MAWGQKCDGIYLSGDYFPSGKRKLCDSGLSLPESLFEGWGGHFDSEAPPEGQQEYAVPEQCGGSGPPFL